MQAACLNGDYFIVCSEAASGHLHLLVCPEMPSITVDADGNLATLLCSCQRMQKAAQMTAAMMKLLATVGTP